MFAEWAEPPVETGRTPERLRLMTRSGSKPDPVEFQLMQTNTEPRAAKKKRPPPVTEQCNPEAELEHELQEHPDDASTKVDVGSDESMDASDPVSVVQPEHREPAPSSGFDEEDESQT